MEVYIMYLVFVSMLSYTYGAGPVYLNNVNCAPYVDYISTDPGQYRYDPMYINLHRCHGKHYAANPVNRKCLPKPKSKSMINISVYTWDGIPKTLKVENHTECSQECIISQQNCTKYGTFHNKECTCKCDFNSSTGKKKCEAPFQWDQFKCDCACPIKPETVTCGNRKEFSTEECGCTCKAKHFIRCAKRKQSIDRDTCFCTDPVITTGAQKSGCDGGVSGAMLAVIILVEAFVIVFGYYFFYVYCYKHNYLGGKIEKNGSAGYYHNGDVTTDSCAVNGEYRLNSYDDDYNLNEVSLSDKERIQREEYNRDKAKYPLISDKDRIQQEEKAKFPHYYPDEEKSPLTLKQEAPEYYLYNDIMEVDGPPGPPSSTSDSHNLNIPPDYSDCISDLSEDGYASVTQV